MNITFICFLLIPLCIIHNCISNLFLLLPLLDSITRTQWKLISILKTISMLMYILHLIITKQHNNNIVIVIVFSPLIILAAPVVTTNNSLLESFDIDDTLTLMFSFEGVPLPTLDWTHNVLPISSSNDSVTITSTIGLSYGTSTLQWVNVSPDTVGTFTCVATNNLGSANRSINVQIRSKFANWLMSGFVVSVTFIVVGVSASISLTLL